MSTTRKMDWQRQKRREFTDQYGYSMHANYGAGGLRNAVLDRDWHRCIECGLSDREHKAIFGRPITIDHLDKNRRHNTLNNLRTMCLRCHGRKDLIPALRAPRVPKFKAGILAARAQGYTYQAIADQFGFSIAAIWKWLRRWSPEGKL